MIKVADNPLVQAQIRKVASATTPPPAMPPPPPPVRYTRAPLAADAGPALNP